MNAHALICDAQRRFALREVTLPDPGPHDLVIRTLWSGVSIGTEFMMVRSTLDRIFYPLCTGYTATGVVEAAGADVSGYAAGDLVYFRASPGMLLDGETVCTAAGTHSSHSVIDARRPDTAHLPAGTPADVASAFVLPGVGLHGVDISNPRLGDSVLVLGVGLVGLSVVVWANQRGCVVVAVDPSRFSLEDARLPEVVAGWQAGTDRPAGSETRQLAERLRGLSGAERETELVEFLTDELAALLRLRAGPPPDAGFFDMGMDSLFAVEFGNRVTRALPGVRAAPGTLVFDHPTIQRLARYLASELGGAEDPEAPSAPATERDAEREAERISSLSREDFLAEVEARLDAGPEDS